MDDSDEPKLLQGLVALVDAFAREFVCPISLELPVDAVTAEDGRIYERSAIACHIATQGASLRSPVTNEPMGPRLLPATQVRNALELIVQNKAVTGRLCETWVDRIAAQDAHPKVQFFDEHYQDAVDGVSLPLRHWHHTRAVRVAHGDGAVGPNNGVQTSRQTSRDPRRATEGMNSAGHGQRSILRHFSTTMSNRAWLSWSREQQRRIQATNDVAFLE